MRLRIGSGSEERGAIAFFLMSFLGMPLSHELACLFVACERNQSRKKAFPKSSLPTAALPKSALPFSLLLPAVKLLMEIPSCFASAPILHTKRRSALILRRWLRKCLQYMPCSKRSPSIFCYHFSFFTLFLRFCSPSELTSALCSATNGMKIRNDR